MSDYLQRDQAPLGVDQWAAFDQTATRTAQSMLVARRFINLVGPFGPGIEALPNDTLSGATADEVAERFGHAEHSFARNDRLDPPSDRGHQQRPVAAVWQPIFVGTGINHAQYLPA